MKHLILTWIIILGAVGIGFAQTQKTMVKTLAVEEQYETVIFALQGQTEVMEWDNKTIRIITKINTPNAEEQILKALIVAGRYEYKITKNEAEGTLTIDMPKRENTVIINGMDLEDDLQYQIFIPRGMKYELQTEHHVPMM